MTDASLGEREIDVMTVLWATGPGTVAEVRERLGVPLAYNTVLTILRNLEAKGFVDHEIQGRFHCYRAAVSEQSVRGSAVSRLVSKFFGGSPVGVVTHLVDSAGLSRDEMRELARLLNERVGDDTPKKKR